MEVTPKQKQDAIVGKLAGVEAAWDILQGREPIRRFSRRDLDALDLRLAAVESNIPAPTRPKSSRQNPLDALDLRLALVERHCIPLIEQAGDDVKEALEKILATERRNDTTNRNFKECLRRLLQYTPDD